MDCPWGEQGACRVRADPKASKAKAPTRQRPINVPPTDDTSIVPEHLILKAAGSRKMHLRFFFLGRMLSWKGSDSIGAVFVGFDLAMRVKLLGHPARR
jgi:hypothetical protein